MPRTPFDVTESMKKGEILTNAVLVLLVAVLAVICVGSVVRVM